MIFQEELYLLWFIKNQRIEKSWNEHFDLNHQIDWPNDMMENYFETWTQGF